MTFQKKAIPVVEIFCEKGEEAFASFVQLGIEEEGLFSRVLIIEKEPLEKQEKQREERDLAEEIISLAVFRAAKENQLGIAAGIWKKGAVIYARGLPEKRPILEYKREELSDREEKEAAFRIGKNAARYKKQLPLLTDGVIRKG